MDRSSDDSIECYKACLIANQFAQEYGIDYKKNFAPVAHLTFVQSLLEFTWGCCGTQVKTKSNGRKKCLSQW